MDNAGHLSLSQCPWMVLRTMGLLPDTRNCGLRMRRECRERFPHHRLQRKPLVSDPDIHQGTCVTHVGISNQRWRENAPGIPSACATHNFAYLARGPCIHCVWLHKAGRLRYNILRRHGKTTRIRYFTALPPLFKICLVYLLCWTRVVKSNLECSIIYVAELTKDNIWQAHGRTWREAH